MGGPWVGECRGRAVCGLGGPGAVGSRGPCGGLGALTVGSWGRLLGGLVLGVGCLRGRGLAIGGLEARLGGLYWGPLCISRVFRRGGRRRRGRGSGVAAVLRLGGLKGRGSWVGRGRGAVLCGGGLLGYRVGGGAVYVGESVLSLLRLGLASLLARSVSLGSLGGEARSFYINV